jgi:hypothetical protein
LNGLVYALDSVRFKCRDEPNARFRRTGGIEHRVLSTACSAAQTGGRRIRANLRAFPIHVGPLRSSRLNASFFDPKQEPQKAVEPVRLNMLQDELASFL